MVAIKMDAIKRDAGGEKEIMLDGYNTKSD